MPPRFRLRTFRLPAFRLPRPQLPRPQLPRAARPPAALVLVGGVVATVIVTGHPVTGAQPAVTPRPVAQGSVVAPLAGPLADGLQVAHALDALARSRDSGADGTHASRSESRTPLAHKHPAPQHRWVRPNSGPLTSPFGYRWGRLHAGIDLAGPYGSPIVAATDGCITYAGPMAGYGEVMDITDWDGTVTVYGHMSAFVRRSGCVKAGQVIARVGQEGDATGPHLHFEVHVGGVPVNPIPFLAKRHLYI